MKSDTKKEIVVTRAMLDAGAFAPQFVDFLGYFAVEADTEAMLDKALTDIFMAMSKAQQQN